MASACREAGLAVPVFEVLATRFRVTISTQRGTRPVRDKRDEAILACISGSAGLLTNEMATAIGLSARATRTGPARLVGGGLLREIGTGPQEPRRRYFPAE